MHRPSMIAHEQEVKSEVNRVGQHWFFRIVVFEPSVAWDDRKSDVGAFAVKGLAQAVMLGLDEGALGGGGEAFEPWATHNTIVVLYPHVLTASDSGEFGVENVAGFPAVEAVAL